MMEAEMKRPDGRPSAFARIACFALPALFAFSSVADEMRYRLFDTKPATDDKTGWEWQS